MSFSDWKDRIAGFKKIDVRGVAGNFFPGLKKQAMVLPVGSGLEVIQTFEPIPLYEVMAQLSFEYHTVQAAEGEFHAYFYIFELRYRPLIGLSFIPQ